MWAYDPAAPWSVGTNPARVFSLRDAEQARPYALASAGRYLAIGTEGSYGVAGGALHLFDPATGTARAFPELSAGHSVTGLAFHNGVLFGGTSIFGGNGSTPAAGDARVFAMDPVTGGKRWEVVPIPGEKAVSGLTIDGDGHVWGVTAGSVFELDPATGQVLRTAVLAPFDWSAVGEWNPIPTKIGYQAADGHLYVSVRARLFRLNHDTLADSAPAGTSAGMLVTHSNGAAYWVAGQNLYEGRF